MTATIMTAQQDRAARDLSPSKVTPARLGEWAVTVSSAIIFLWFGALKFLPFEAESLVGIISNNPLISWLYPLFGVTGGAQFLGVFEVTTGLLIAGRVFSPKLSVIGGAMGHGPTSSPSAACSPCLASSRKGMKEHSRFREP